MRAPNAGLSSLGRLPIARNCACIVDVADDRFRAHGFDDRGAFGIARQRADAVPVIDQELHCTAAEDAHPPAGDLGATARKVYDSLPH